ncbi:30S ribosomal protein S8e [Sulfolobus acidocaldarius]|uniref:Small ribosomal subunit protein eS8 n=5 Tax=Sulfolobus acidocaldarius TaxID=2285 RepID=RS8E_SULAC|nr:30S ribosomal protein S8e [Sulfolobus acidocaldarius]Q4JAP5.1 RecName: Full=Small ribosomal subunit protein eS8; AltName: Full=30S ribosomal protein S8e [Sulfolobus acidocaldarius DSM 639]AAY80134.1 30S ribosomal protein S8E [Sulfolobus acidocaldarius DSM 639]AGE70709.1 30S ribosomal protein S8e [Sulfolobus acidocaldarius N8]AGE72981.1 30S ribosomal protein S8e [Sulfolobus acidocaldarius Ron12/I]ALU28952.1 30S ribosomal protein S8e [Sulfolobus acidocaldarius]ALU31678.1 30S ribosomal protei
MSYYQGNDSRKITGGQKGKNRDKRKYELGSPPTETKISDKDIKEKDRVAGGNFKLRLRYASYANVYDPQSKTAKKVKIISVLESPANREYARRGIIVKGTLIQTELGKAKVTSRPGQDGIINALLLRE